MPEVVYDGEIKEKEFTADDSVQCDAAHVMSGELKKHSV